MYVFLTGDLRAAYRAGGQAVPAGVSWEQLAGVPLRPGAGAAGLGVLGVFPGFLGQVDPRGLLALLQSATDVRETGPASGPGWTGSAYTFSIAPTLTGPLHTAVSLRGTVDVDQQGRVQQLDGQASFATTVSQVEITFGDFGLPVSVSPPPASQTWVPPGR